MTRDELIEIIGNEVYIEDNYGSYHEIAGISNAADAILAKLENPFGKYGDPDVSDDCEFCYGDGNCYSRNDGWGCTRELGHTGPHVACSGAGGHSVATWPNTKDKQ